VLQVKVPHQCFKCSQTQQLSTNYIKMQVPFKTTYTLGSVRTHYHVYTMKVYICSRCKELLKNLERFSLFGAIIGIVLGIALGNRLSSSWLGPAFEFTNFGVVAYLLFTGIVGAVIGYFAVYIAYSIDNPVIGKSVRFDGKTLEFGNKEYQKQFFLLNSVMGDAENQSENPNESAKVEQTGKAP
jgi:hypothetical protein